MIGRCRSSSSCSCSHTVWRVWSPEVFGLSTTHVRHHFIFCMFKICKWSGLPDFLAILYSEFHRRIDLTRFLLNQGKLRRRGGSTFFENAFLHNWQKGALPFNQTRVDIIWGAYSVPLSVYGGPGVQYVRFIGRSKLNSQLDSQVWSSICSSIQRSEARFADL